MERRGDNGCVYACARKEIRKEGGSVWLAENRTAVGGKRYATAFWTWRTLVHTCTRGHYSLRGESAARFGAVLGEHQADPKRPGNRDDGQNIWSTGDLRPEIDARPSFQSGPIHFSPPSNSIIRPCQTIPPLLTPASTVWRRLNVPPPLRPSLYTMPYD